MTVGFDRFLNVRGAFGATFDASGQRLYFISTASGSPDLWALRLDQAEAWPEPLVVGPERVQYAFPSLHSGRLVFGLDRGGDEQTQLFLLDELGASPLPLTRDPDAIHHFGAWHPDARTICYAANVRDARYFDLYVRDVQQADSRLVYQHDSHQRVHGFRPAGVELLVQRIHTPFQHELLLVDPAGGSARSLTAGTPVGRYQSAQWSPDGRSIYCATDRDGDFLALARVSPSSGDIEYLAEGPADVDDLAVSPSGERLAYACNVGGYSEITLLDLTNGARREIRGPASSVCYDAGRWLPTFAWSPDGHRLGVTLTTAVKGLDVWLCEFDGPLSDEPRLRRATRSWDAGLPPEALVQPDLVRYPTFDGREIPAFVFRRGDQRPDESGRPALFYVHGGPESQLRPSFNPIIQYFAQRGFTVVAPNVRGSTGYGRCYSHLDDLERRLDAVRDLVAGAEWLAASGQADPRKIAVMGASYGGYMVLAALTERPDLWAAGVDIVGIANFVTFLERTGPWRRRQREAEYGSLEHHRDLLEGLSPLHKTDRISAPLMVVHGANDPRVPVSEAEQIVATLQGRGQPVEYLRFEDEGHGLVRLANRLAAYPRIAQFLELHLGMSDEPSTGRSRSGLGL